VEDDGGKPGPSQRSIPQHADDKRVPNRCNKRCAAFDAARRSRNRFAEAVVAAKVFAAVCIEGYFRLTDIAARSKFSMQVAERATNVAIARHGLRGGMHAAG
jgi:hypothetical protein